ncbi:hypothetical protein NB502_03180 [Vibrio diabolicus]|uniref:hypothetical protein n=1 Tax=Vibrio diabolicus TaxID=50719 RepID=UPI00215C2C2B|nr:hypothetical protein [Vibrio diabolicus]MCR9470851.1 hypothetical protein [Vibrio diabolicus]HDM8222196.1 hypothetical protein [Vibrio campbellii]HDM8245542.1 hypothetical protein [Vibrio campbellii]
MFKILKRYELWLGVIAGIVTSTATIFAVLPNYLPFSPPIVTISEQERIPVKWKANSKDTWALVYKIKNYGGENLELASISMGAVPNISVKKHHIVHFDMYDVSEKEVAGQTVTIKPGKEKLIAITLTEDLHRSTKALIKDKVYSCSIEFIYSNSEFKGHNAANRCRPDYIYDMLIEPI